MFLLKVKFVWKMILTCRLLKVNSAALTLRSARQLLIRIHITMKNCWLQKPRKRWPLFKICIMQKCVSPCFQQDCSSLKKALEQSCSAFKVGRKINAASKQIQNRYFISHWAGERYMCVYDNGERESGRLPLPLLELMLGESEREEEEERKWKREGAR